MKGITWLDSNAGINESADILDAINIVNGKSIDLEKNESEVELSEAPFPDISDHKEHSINLLTHPFQLKSLSHLSTTDEYYSPDKNLISVRKIRKTYKSKIPTLALKSVVSKKCNPYYLDQRLNNAQNSKAYLAELRNFFNKCDKKLIRRIRNTYLDMAKLSYRNYKVLQNKNTHKFRLNFNNGTLTEGYLALKPSKKRPLVIIKCGIFCDGRGSGINNNLTASLYDSGPFHIMLVANNTGPTNINQNSRVNFGGFIEGQEVMEIADWAKNESYFKNYISEVHVLGISLGGHAALYTTIFNEELENKLISSVIGFCPVVNLKNSLADATSRGPIGLLVSHIVQKLILKNYDNIPTLQDHFTYTEIPDMKKMPARLAKVNTKFIQGLNSNDFLAPYTGINIKDEHHFLELSDFIKQAKKISTPTLVWGSNNDPLVRAKRNSRLLAHALPHPTEDKDIQVLNVKKGGHCAVSESYDWQTVSQILNNFFIRHSPSLIDSKKVNTSKINFSQPSLDYGESYVIPRLLTFSQFDKLVIEYKIYKGFPYRDPFYASSSQFRYETIEIPFDRLPFKLTVPQSTVEAQILTRWLNANVKLKVDNQLLIKSKNPPNQIEWTSY